jgi:transcriptional regulator with XRE-family HTH domain
VRMDPVRSMEHDGIPPRTELFSLEPIGPGTPFVEGLTGYIYRLASRHVLPVTDFLDVDRLMRFQRTDVDRRVRRRLFHASCYLLDGHEIETNRWIEALEAATGRIGLRSLTILPYVGFSADSWLRAWKAWCPQCYSVWRDKCLPTYEPLLWSIKAVSICPIHHAPLVELCPTCTRRFKPLTSGSSIGHCGHCLVWLGTPTGDGKSTKNIDKANALLLWSAQQIGTLLATVPQLSTQLSPKVISRLLSSLISRNRSSSIDLLSKRLGISRRSLTTWARGETLPRLDGLCKLSFSIGAPLVDLLLGKITCARASFFLINTSDGSRLDGPRADAEANTSREISPPKRKVSADKPVTEFQTEAALRQALLSTPPPTLDFVAKRLGLINSSLLRKRHSDMCDDLLRKHRSWRAKEIEQMRTHLEAALAETEPRSPKQILNNYGISQKLCREEFPELKQALHDRYIQWQLDVRRQKQEVFKLNVAETVKMLLERGTYPSAGNVLATCPSLRSGGWDRLQRAIRGAQRNDR